MHTCCKAEPMLCHWSGILSCPRNTFCVVVRSPFRLAWQLFIHFHTLARQFSAIFRLNNSVITQKNEPSENRHHAVAGADEKTDRQTETKWTSYPMKITPMICLMVHQTNGVSNKEYTAKELRASCLRVANGLRLMGLRKGETLSIYSGNSVQFIIMSLGTLAAGGIFSTVNSNFKEGKIFLRRPYDDILLLSYTSRNHMTFEIGFAGCCRGIDYWLSIPV